MAGNLITIVDDEGEKVTVTGGKLDVNATVSGSGDGAIQDGANSTIEATVFDYANSNPLAVRLTDTNGDYIAAGAGTQYTEDAAAAADPVGTALMMVRDDALSGQTTLDGDNVAARGTDKGELYVKHVDAIPVTDNAGSLTIDAASLPLPTGAATSALQLPDGHNVTVDNAAGAAAVNVQDGGNSLTIDGSVSVTGAVDTELTTADVDTGAGTDTRAVVGLVGTASGGGQLIPGSAADGLLVNLGANNDITGTVTANLAAGANNIGDVDVLSVPAPLSTTGGGTEATALRVTVASDSTGVLSVDDNGGALTVDNAGTFAVQATAVGTVADDAITPGAPVMVGGQAVSPDGTDPTSVAEADVVRFRTDLNRRLYVATNHPRTWRYHLNTSTAQTDTSIQAAPGAGLRVVITNIQFTSGAATAINLFLEEATTTIWGPIYLEAVAGRGYVSGPIFLPITANTAVTYTTSAAIAHAVDILGFIEAV